MPRHSSRVYRYCYSLSLSLEVKRRVQLQASMICITPHIQILLLNAFPSKACKILVKNDIQTTTLKTKALEHHIFGTRFIPSNLFIKRQRFITNVSSSSTSVDQELPLLPFPIQQVLIPTESKTLHLYEARYLALLDESLLGKNKYFVHFVLDPISNNDTSEASFAARYGCLVVIEKVERLDVGALVSIRGIGRVNIVNFVQAEPYLKGVVKPIQDVVPDSTSKLNSQIAELKEALQCLNGLEIKLKAPKEALLQTRIANSLQWAEKELSLDNYEAFLPQLAERLSFAALQPVSGLTQSESVKLQKEKLKAMNTKETIERLTQSLEFAKDNISMVAAKLAIQSLDA